MLTLTWPLFSVNRACSKAFVVASWQNQEEINKFIQAYTKWKGDS